MKSLQIGDLTIPVPVIQGGMGVGVSLSGLASAVANEGGVGVISSAGLGLLNHYKNTSYSEANALGLKYELQEARKKSNGVIGVNIMSAMSNYCDLVKTSISEKADIIFIGAGLPLNLPGFLNKDCKTKLVPIVSSGRATKIICEKWKSNYDYLPDAIVVEGPKAGGHIGFKNFQINDKNYSLEKLVTDVIAVTRILEDKYNVKIPVIAAGGIYTGKDIHEIMSLGVSGVQMGTRFVTTNECDASDSFKQSYINSKAEDVEIINSPVGMPGRAIKSNFMNMVKKGEKLPVKCPFKCITTCKMSSSQYCIIKALINALKGNFDKGFAFAGSNAYLSEKIISVNETFENIKKEYKAT